MSPIRLQRLTTRVATQALDRRAHSSSAKAGLPRPRFVRGAQPRGPASPATLGAAHPRPTVRVSRLPSRAAVHRVAGQTAALAPSHGQVRMSAVSARAAAPGMLCLVSRQTDQTAAAGVSTLSSSRCLHHRSQDACCHVDPQVARLVRLHAIAGGHPLTPHHAMSRK